MQLFAIGFILLTIYFLFVKGILYKLIMLFFGWIGMYAYLYNSYPSLKETAITLGGYAISGAAIIPSIIVILAMLTTKVKDD